MGNIIILNGCSSSGKTSLAFELQNILKTPYLYFSLDMFMRTLPSELIVFQDNQDKAIETKGIAFIQKKDGSGKNCIDVYLGVYGDKMIKGYINAIKGIAEAGNNIICDTILADSKWYEYLIHTLKDFECLFIGLYAPLEVLEQREAYRGEPQGMARGRFKNVYDQKYDYDLFLDTSKYSLKECTNQIEELIEFRN